MARSLTDDQVRQAKQLGMAGVKPVRIARALGCNVETIRRYLRGESRANVVVEGEEAIRPPAADLPESSAIGAAELSLASLQLLLNQSTKETSCKSATATAESLPEPKSANGNFLD